MEQLVASVSWKKLKPEDKVRVTIEMVDVVTQISADNEREKNPNISEEELISRLRRRFRLDERFHSR
jgi:RecB family endonuclease NucS